MKAKHKINYKLDKLINNICSKPILTPVKEKNKIVINALQGVQEEYRNFAKIVKESTCKLSFHLSVVKNWLGFERREMYKELYLGLLIYIILKYLRLLCYSMKNKKC